MGTLFYAIMAMLRFFVFFLCIHVFSFYLIWRSGQVVVGTFFQHANFYSTDYFEVAKFLFINAIAIIRFGAERQPIEMIMLMSAAIFLMSYRSMRLLIDASDSMLRGIKVLLRYFDVLDANRKSSLVLSPIISVFSGAIKSLFGVADRDPLSVPPIVRMGGADLIYRTEYVPRFHNDVQSILNFDFPRIGEPIVDGDEHKNDFVGSKIFIFDVCREQPGAADGCFLVLTGRISYNNRHRLADDLEFCVIKKNPLGSQRSPKWIRLEKDEFESSYLIYSRTISEWQAHISSAP